MQLAICIEIKRQLTEDFQDCIGSEDHLSPRVEVITALCLFYFIVLDYAFLLPKLAIPFNFGCMFHQLKLQKRSIVGEGSSDMQTPDEYFDRKRDR